MGRKIEDFGQKNASELKPLKLPIPDIELGRRMRPLDRKSLDSLKLSIDTIGLQTPITVRRDEEGGYHLVTGLHRLKAAEELGWHFIDSIMVEWDEHHAL